MGLFDSLRDVVRTFSGDDYDDDYEAAPAAGVRPGNIYSVPNTASTAPDYAALQYTSGGQPVEAAQPTAVPDAVVSAIALLRPESLESVREAADHLVQNHAVIISLKHTEPSLARRWLDYLGGTTYTLGGKINRIAPYTYLLTPSRVELVAGFESEFEE